VEAKEKKIHPQAEATGAQSVTKNGVIRHSSMSIFIIRKRKLEVNDYF
jgi:hypothetical protein